MYWSEYVFNNSGRLDSDETDQTQQSMQNSRLANYVLSNFVQDNILSAAYIDFESKNLTLITGNPTGPGIGPDVIDADSELSMNFVIERPFEKIDLFPRPFLTVPYLGRGSCDCDLESRMRTGESFLDKKSVATIMDKNFTEYAVMPPVSDSDPNENRIEEQALNGWTRGGARTRDYSE